MGNILVGLLVLFDYEGANPVSAEQFPCATARNTEQVLVRPLSSMVLPRHGGRVMLYLDRTKPGRASSARSLLSTVQDMCFAPGCWHYCKE